MGWQRCPLCGVFGELDACLGLFEACVCARESPVASALLYLVGVQKSSCKLGARVAVWSPSRLLVVVFFSVSKASASRPSGWRGYTAAEMDEHPWLLEAL